MMLRSVTNWFLPVISGKWKTKGRETQRPNTLPRREHRRCRFERLEERKLFAVDLADAFEISNSGSDRISDIEVDSAGYKYVAGAFSGSFDFDPDRELDGDTLSSRGSSDAFIAKYAPDDSLLWVRRMGGDAQSTATTDVASKLSIDSNGNVFVAGNMWDTADFGSTTLIGLSAVNSGFIAKLSPSGDFAWATQLTHGSSSAIPKGLGVDSSGSAYVALQSGSSSIGIAKYSSAGTLSWSKSLVNSSSNVLMASDLAVNSSGNSYLVGHFQGTVDFDPSSKIANTSSGSYAGAYILNLDSSGNYKWMSPFLGTGSNPGFAHNHSVTLDNSGSIIVGGTYLNSVDFKPGSGVTSLDAAGGGHIAKLTNTGSLTWVRELKKVAASNIWVYSLDTDAFGSIYASGSFSGSIDFAPGTPTNVRTSNGDNDIFALKLNSSGTHQWDVAMGGTGADVSFAIAVDSQNNVQLAGYFADTIDIDPDPLKSRVVGSQGSRSNGFLVRMRQS